MVNNNMTSDENSRQKAAPLDDLPGYLLRKAARVMMAELASRLAPLDLRIVDASVLLLVADREDITSSEIGKALEIQRANMVPLLARLEAASLIERKALDRKSQAIHLTPTGHDRLQDVRTITGQFENELVDRIPVEHRAHLVPALQALIG